MSFHARFICFPLSVLCNLPIFTIELFYCIWSACGVQAIFRFFGALSGLRSVRYEGIRLRRTACGRKDGQRRIYPIYRTQHAPLIEKTEIINQEQYCLYPTPCRSFPAGDVWRHLGPYGKLFQTPHRYCQDGVCAAFRSHGIDDRS